MKSKKVGSGKLNLGTHITGMTSTLQFPRNPNIPQGYVIDISVIVDNATVPLVDGEFKSDNGKYEYEVKGEFNHTKGCFELEIFKKN